MHAKILLLGSTAEIGAVIAAVASQGVTICSVELSTSDGDSLQGLSLGSGNAASTNIGSGTPAPMPIPSAPITLAPIQTAPVETEEEGDETDGAGLDAAGLPWDERIHSSSKKRGKDGTWNKRRGGPSGAELAAIEAELRGVTAAPVLAPLPPVAPPLPTVVAAEPPVPLAPLPPAVPLAPVLTPVAPPMPPVEAAPTVAAEPSVIPATPAPAAPVELDFPTFMQQIGPKMGEGEGQINGVYLNAVCQSLGMNTMTDLALKPELIGRFVMQLQADGRW